MEKRLLSFQNPCIQKSDNREKEVAIRRYQPKAFMIQKAFTFYFLHFFLLFFFHFLYTQEVSGLPHQMLEEQYETAEKRAALSCVWRDVSNQIIGVFTKLRWHDIEPGIVLKELGLWVYTIGRVTNLQPKFTYIICKRTNPSGWLIINRISPKRKDRMALRKHLYSCTTG